MGLSAYDVRVRISGDTTELVRWWGGTLIEIMIIAVSKLRSLCDRAISRLSHSSARSMYVTANANTLTAAHIHILD